MAGSALSLGEQLRLVSGSANSQEPALIKAGAIIARYVENISVQRQDGTPIEPVQLTPELLTNEDSYPRIKFIVPKERIDDALTVLKAIDTKLPTMPGLTFNQLVCCNEENCMIVINAGAVLVCEFAGEIANKIPPKTPDAKRTPALALENVS